ncbi:MAG: alkylation response protein AidB-like acyl-CoA dehydrogenase [Bermanella sp.]|jgi:alkylation response protein AidB-like acyl-CoA dehydrogenase
MQYQYSEEQTLLKGSLRKFVDDNYSYEARCRLVATQKGFSDEHWQQLAELGVLGLPFAEEFGGYEGDLAFLAAVAQECGRGLVAEPFFSTVVLAGQLLAASDAREVKAELLPKVARGELKLALAWEERGSRGDPTRIETGVSIEGDKGLLSGEKRVVLGAQSADYLLVTALAPSDKLVLLLVDAKADGLHMRGYTTVDGGRAANVNFSKVAATVLSVDAKSSIQRALDRALIVLCAQALGAMDALMEATLEHCKTRKQFGMPIASFQVLQHRMADMHIASEKTRSLLWAAIQADERGDCHHAASVLKAQVGEGGRYVGQQAVQLHGGIGMTDELSVGAYFKLLTQIDVLFGNRDFHLALLAKLARVPGKVAATQVQGLRRA